METRTTYIEDFGEVTLSMEDIESICVSGINDDAVKSASAKPYIREQFRNADEKNLIKAAEHIVCEELKDKTKQNAMEIIIWIAAWQINDEIYS